MVVLNPRLALESPVKELPKVKPLDLKRLTALGIRTVRDLLLDLPFAWDEFGDPKPIAQLTPGTLATVTGTIIKIEPQISRYKKLKMTKAKLEDDNDDGLNLVWFNQPWVAKQLEKGDRVAVAGTVRATGFGLEMRNPHHEKLAGGDGAAPSRPRSFPVGSTRRCRSRTEWRTSCRRKCAHATTSCPCQQPSGSATNRSRKATGMRLAGGWVLPSCSSCKPHSR